MLVRWIPESLKCARFWPHTRIYIATMSLDTGTRSHSPSLSGRPDKRPRTGAQDVQQAIRVQADANAVAQGTVENSASEAQGTRPPMPQTKRQKKKRPKFEPYSPDDVLFHDVIDVLSEEVVNVRTAAGEDWDAPLSYGTEVELVVTSLSSSGDSLSVLPPPHPPWAVVVPFALPGERIRARIYRNARLFSMADLLHIEAPNTTLRDMNRVKCKYFGRCAGCQYQMMSYENQLDVKRIVVDKAYRNFSGLSPDTVPAALPTIPSPKIYGYRTKITPHFDAPPKKAKVDASKKEWELRIGFAAKGRRTVIDIEECPIATPLLNEALGPARKTIQENIHNYKRGATLLLRDSLVTTTSASTVESQHPNESPAPAIESLSNDLEHICITDHKAIVRERVGSLHFEFPAGSFFQNNNSVLEPLTAYVRETVQNASTPTHLVDAYCGSGLFSVTLATYFSKVAGVEINPESIQYARRNAVLNGVPPGTCTFHAGQAEAIFASVSDFPPERTVVVVDPPRKGCDALFVEQLLAFRPMMVVYVSCNVHTQARDVGMILRKEKTYKLESLRGFDLFPQTAHVESVAVLRRDVT